MRKICIITGTRAEYGLLKKILHLIHNDSSLRLQLIVTGTHLSKKYGYTRDEIESDGFCIDISIDILEEQTNKSSTIRSLSKAILGFSEAFENLQPDLILILGDRYEILAAAQAAMIHQIPMAHIHGGEKTEGAFDDAIRHSVTKMSHLHFVANSDSKKRVEQLGENPERVFNFGAPGLDDIPSMSLWNKKKLSKNLLIDFAEKIMVITYHPVTLQTGSPLTNLSHLLAALDRYHDDTTLIFTMPNADPESDHIMAMIQKYVETNSNAFLFSSLGRVRYLSLVNIADLVIGNSSSGIIEAPFLKTPTIDIGIRQKGRLKAESIISCDPDRDKIVEAINRALSNEFKDKTANAHSLYGNGNASKRIVEKIKSYPLNNILIKTFWDGTYES